MLMKRKRKTLEMGERVPENPDLIKIQAAGGLLYRVTNDVKNPEILLIFRNDVWDLPKGKLEVGESIAECAAREVQEEIGLAKQPEIIAELGTTYHSYSLKNQTIEKETFWFVMSLAEEPDEFTPQKAEEITRVDWVPAKEALQTVGYDNLVEVIHRFLKDIGNVDKIKLG